MSRTGTRPAGFEDVETLKDVDGVIAVITRNLANGTLSVGFFKEFERGGETQRTAFMQKRHLDAVARLLPKVSEYIEGLVDQERAAKRAAGGSP